MNDLIPMLPKAVAPHVDPMLTPGSAAMARRQERLGLLREMLGAIEDATPGGQRYLMTKLLVLLRQEGLQPDRSFTAQQRDVVNRALTDLEHEAARLAPDADLFERPARTLVEVLALG